MKFTTDGKTLGKSIADWAKRKSGVVNDLHKLTVMCICHSLEHGDVTYINKLDQAATDGTDAKGKSIAGINLYSLRKYFEEKAPVKWVKADKQTGKPGHFGYDATKAVTMIAEYKANPDGFRDNLMETPFWQVHTAPDPFEGFDVWKAIKSQLAKFKRLKADPTKADKVIGNEADVARIERELARLEKQAVTGNPEPVAEAEAKAKATARKPRPKQKV